MMAVHLITKWTRMLHPHVKISLLSVGMLRVKAPLKHIKLKESVQEQVIVAGLHLPVLPASAMQMLLLIDCSVSSRNRSRVRARDFHRNTRKLFQTKSERLITCFDGSKSTSCPSARGVPQSEQVTAGLGRTTCQGSLLGSILAVAAGTATGRKPTA